MTHRPRFGSRSDFTDGSVPIDLDAPRLNPTQSLERSLNRMEALERLAKKPGLKPVDRHRLLSLARQQWVIVSRKLARIPKH